MTNAEDISFMREALDLAQQAAALGEVPVGAVVVQHGQVIGRGHNRPIGQSDASAHAEVVALRMAGEQIANYRLPGASLYVTLEPCMMCLGAMVHARVETIVFAASDPKSGVLGGQVDLSQAAWLNHHCNVRAGVLADEAAKMLRAFFRTRRDNRRGSAA
ncbi:MAG: tRNA adenosine(34) deaminase TadA [Pseudomonadota bacterium]